MTNVVLTGNTSYRGGAVYVAGSLVMDQVTATHNRTRSASPSHGGAIAVDGNLTATNITLTHNVAEDCFCGGDQAHGGGIYVGGSAVISAAAFIDNRSIQNSGGGLYVTGDLTLSNSDFVSNSARYNGGGIHVTGNLTLSSSDIVSNSSRTNGGGVNVDGTLALSDVRFIRNVATNFGGGLASGFNDSITATVTATVEASSFISNQAQFGGGAALHSGIVRNSRFEDNKAHGSSPLGGGGLAVLVQATIENNHFARNIASIGGAAQLLFYPPEASSDVSRIINNLWVDNAGRDGAALSIGADLPGFQGDHAIITHNTIVRQTSNNDSALYIAKSASDVANNIITQHRIGLHASSASVIADANLLHANAINYLGIEGGPNDLTADPLFLDPANHDYHLQSGSPAQDSGLDLDVAADLDGLSRPQGKGYERGAFEIVHVNGVPIGRSDAYTTPVDTSLVVPVLGVLDNDSDPDGDVLTATMATVPAHGELVLQPVGAFIYTPTVGFTGTDSFTYQASDGIDSSAAVAVTIIVESDPSPQPVAITGLGATNDGPVAAGRTVNFVAVVETGSDIRFVWDFGDGTTEEGATASHVYAEPGNYSVTITASNSLGVEQATTGVIVLPHDGAQNQTFVPFTAK
jgi:predicted outer membrane repeat protein